MYNEKAEKARMGELVRQSVASPNVAFLLFYIPLLLKWGKVVKREKEADDVVFYFFVYKIFGRTEERGNTEIRKEIGEVRPELLLFLCVQN